MVNDDMPPDLPEDKQKALALELLLDAWDDALEKGVAAELLASTAIFAAFTDMVDQFGIEPVAQMAETLPSRIREGEFSFDDEDDEEEDGDDADDEYHGDDDDEDIDEYDDEDGDEEDDDTPR